VTLLSERLYLTAKKLGLIYISLGSLWGVLNYNYRAYTLINIREYRRGNQKGTIQRNWQIRAT
jgi:hypothetical protein